MENRVQRLAFEDLRAQKLLKEAKQKADKMLQARVRHQNVSTEWLIYFKSQMLYYLEAPTFKITNIWV